MNHNIIKSVRNNILVGIFLTVPVMATILIVNFLFGLATKWSLNKETFLRSFRQEHWYGDYVLQFVALIFVLLIFYMVGLLTRNFFGRYIYTLADKLITRIPIIRSIYLPVRQISESLFTRRKTLFKEVVLIEYPRKGLFSLAFVTADAPNSVARIMTDGKENEPCVSLFISTTPNPTSGVFILVPKSEIKPLNMPVADALTFIMSAGAVSNEQEGLNSSSLLDKLQVWLRHDSPQEETKNAETPTT